MPLNEIVEEHSIESISQRTRISPDNLRALMDRDWFRLRKVQALGFLSILEREYGIDLSDLRAECQNYFQSHLPNDKGISVTSEEVIEHKRGPLPRLLFLFVLAAIAYGSWYLFVSKNESLESNVTVTHQGGFYDSVKALATHWFGGEKGTVPEVNDTTDVIVRGAWAHERKKEANASASNSLPAEGNLSGRKSPEETPGAKGGEEKLRERTPARKEKAVTESAPAASANLRENEEDRIIARVKEEQARQMVQDRNAAKLLSEEVSSSAVSVEEKGEEAVPSIPAAADVPTRRGETAGSQERSPQSPLAAPVAGTTRKAAVKQSSSPAPRTEQAPEAAAEKAASSAPAATASGVVLFHPLAKVWVGYTELQSMKRATEVATSDIPFDTKRGDYILATGHGKVEFRRGGKVILTLNDGKKHFFMIVKGGVREMSHEAFRRLNKSKVW